MLLSHGLGCLCVSVCPVEMVELLLEHGADLTHKNACGTCPLSMAVVRGHYDLVEKILDCPLDKCIDDADK